MTAGKVTVFALAVGTAMGLAATLVGQDQQHLQRREANKPVLYEPWQHANYDAQLAQCLSGDNQGEITLGKLAEQRAKDKDVKQFAEKMVRDHEQFGQQLEKFAREGERSTARTDNRQPTGATTATATGQPMEGRGLDLFAIHDQVGKKFLEMVESDLKQKDGSQFDKCYIGQQIGGHMHMIAEMEVLRSHVSPELAAVIDKGVETAKSHLEEAQKLAKSLERS
jgi:predicted outer membrane protein